MPELTHLGIVVEEQKNYYMVSTQEKELRCTVKGALLKTRSFRISAGDAVRVQVINEDTAEGVICETKERSSFLR